ncbi:MAG: hypothetical protein SVO01_00080 [Thermotogota bacterium]|nr:hypothetical protein [Thermotogota bacterium]
MMKVGTKSVLFGTHQFLIHPVFVALAWWKIYGFPFDPRLWLAFVLHDLGYLGKPNMDGPEGEKHPYFAARVMGFLFGAEWYDFCLYHSRFIAKASQQPFSKLCVADKLAFALEPWWLYLPRAIISGEINEYMSLTKSSTDTGEQKYASMNVFSDIRRQWFFNVKEYLRQWVEEHKDGRVDLWTPDMSVRGQTIDDVGTWK